MKKLLFVALLAAGWSGIAQDINPTTGAEVQASFAAAGGHAGQLAG